MTHNLPEIQVIRQNFTRVDLDGLTVWYSYRTAVAFMTPGSRPVVRENTWGQTTGRHLHAINGGDRDSRVGVEEFASLWTAAHDRLFLGTRSAG